MKKLIQACAITCASLAFLLISPIGSANFLEEGPYLEINEEEVNNFFLMDVGDSEFDVTEAQIPTLKPCNGKVTSGFGWRRFSRRSRRGRMHKGLDIAAPRGTPVIAPAAGKVVFVGRKGGYGRTVILDHGGGLQTLYAHNSKVKVQLEEVVSQGQEISLVGSTGRSTGPHLHYEVRVHGQPVNPVRYF